MIDPDIDETSERRNSEVIVEDVDDFLTEPPSPTHGSIQPQVLQPTHPPPSRGALRPPTDVESGAVTSMHPPSTGTVRNAVPQVESAVYLTTENEEGFNLQQVKACMSIKIFPIRSSLPKLGVCLNVHTFYPILYHKKDLTYASP